MSSEISNKEIYDFVFDKENEDIIYPAKFLIVGDGGVGKTCFIQNCLLDVNFVQQYVPTFGIEVYEKNNCKIFDFPGQEKFAKSHETYLSQQNITHCIIMFDLTNSISYKNLEFWEEKLQKICPGCDLLIVGNKSDLTSQIKIQPSFDFCSISSKNK